VPSEVPAELAAVIADFVEHGAVTASTLLDRLQAATAAGA
jgi:hypothetical protein